MNVKLVITRQDPCGMTEVELPPSVEVNGLLSKMHDFFYEQYCRGLDSIEESARQGDIGSIARIVPTTEKLNSIQGALELAHERYEVLLNANPREETPS